MKDDEARDEIQLASQILVRLVKKGIVPLGMEETALRELHLTIVEVHEAKEHIRVYGWTAPRRMQVEPKTHYHKSSAPRPLQRPGTKSRPVNEKGELFCTKCKAWKTPEQFQPRTDRPGKRKSRCITCTAEDQTNRYLNKKRRIAMKEAEISFCEDEDTGTVGIRCNRCGSVLSSDFTGEHKCPSEHLSDSLQ